MAFASSYKNVLRPASSTYLTIEFVVEKNLHLDVRILLDYSLWRSH